MNTTTLKKLGFGIAIAAVAAIGLSLPCGLWAAATPSGGKVVDHSAKLPAVSLVTVQMLAATSDQAPTRVLLKWVVDAQWIPPKGFNLYRKGPGDTEFKKIAGPLQEQANAPQLTVLGVDGMERTLNVAAMQKTARLTVKLPPAQLQMFKPHTQVVLPATEAFEQLRQFRQQQNTAVTGTTRTFAAPATPDAYPALKQFYGRFQPAPVVKAPVSTTRAAQAVTPRSTAPVRTGVPMATAAKKITVQPLSPDLQVLQARQQLMIGSLLNAQVNAALGLGYVDADVKVGETYEYQLRRLKDTGVEEPNPITKCTITVGADPLPAQPAGLSALQQDVKRVSLRWTLDETKSSARVIGYHIFRTIGTQRVKRNGTTLTVGAIEDSDGKLYDPLYYFTDSDVPVGKVTYELVGVDAFGRGTPPAKLDFTMADWDTPLPPKDISCVENTGTVMVYWDPARRRPATSGSRSVSVLLPDGQAQYNIYRCDAETKPEGMQAMVQVTPAYLLGGMPPSSGLSAKWTKLNAQPLQAAHISLPVGITTGTRRLARGVALQSSSFTYIDKTAEKDHYYRYCVTALYPKNMLESPPSPLKEVAVPDMAAPAPPGELAGKCTPLITKPGKIEFEPAWAKPSQVMTTAAQPRITNLNANVDRAKSAQAVSPKGVGINKPARGGSGSKAGMIVAPLPAGALVKATLANSDLASMVTLTWKAAALTAPVRYRIYRANATGFVHKASGTAEGEGTPERTLIASTAATLGPIAALPNAAINTNKVFAPASARMTPSLQIKGMRLDYIHRLDLKLTPLVEYKLITETSKPTFTDLLPKSRPMYYNYRVTVVNRWGVEGIAAAIQVRIPATIKPPTPRVAYAMPNMDGGVTLSWKPMEDREECKKYLVYRKQIDIAKLMQNIKPLIVPAALRTEAQPAATPHGVFGLAETRAMTSPAAENLTLSRAALDNSARLGVRTLPQIYVNDKVFNSKLRGTLINIEEYGPIAEVSADTLDAQGNVTIQDAKNLTPNTWYSYTVVAVDADTWQSPASKPLLSTVWKVTCPPVGNLKAVSGANGRSVNLSWAPPAGEVSGYVVLRTQGEGETFMQVSDFLKGVTTYTDAGVMPGKTYRYRVLAMDPLGNLSDPVEVACTVNKPGLIRIPPRVIR
ncbi:MAG: fibronectin type III domain-containing protein [Armatimonadota bacterium]